MKNLQNLNSLTKRFYRKSSMYHLNLTTELDEIIIGCLLGDLSAEKKNINSNTRLQFKQSIINIDYVNYLYSLFKDYCGSAPIVIKSFDDRPSKMKEYSAIKFQTLSLPCFNKNREMFYNLEGTKIIPLNLIDCLTARGLAHWIMDDGYKFNKGFYLSTESFTLNEHKLLINILKSKFDLESNYHKHTNGYRLYIFSSSMDKLKSTVKPYVLTHFYYKLGL